MKVILCDSGQDNVVNRCLEKAIESKVTHDHLEIYHSLEDFSTRIHHIPREVDIVVIFTQDDEQLLKIVSLKDFLEGISIILILHSRERATVSQGHLLNPKFIDYFDSDFSNVCAVLEKMMDRIIKDHEIGCMGR